MKLTTIILLLTLSLSSSIFARAYNDSDRDGVPNYKDQCPNTPYRCVVNTSGCPLEEARLGSNACYVNDLDRDGVLNDRDECPHTPKGVVVTAWGCPLEKMDSDNDGVSDYYDLCKGTPSVYTVNQNGCPLYDYDQDETPNQF